jgi:hypothetical protein
MIDVLIPDAALGAMALAFAVLYGAWHEHAAKNPRDARLLTALGVASLAGSALAWVAT